MDARVTFSVSPWLLLILIPVYAAVFALFFIGKKRGPRVTASRIERYEPNAPEELVVLVDNSGTAAGQRENMDGLVREVLSANGGRCRIAVALFGYGQRVVLPMGYHDAESAYEQYIASSKLSPADNATDIASALKLAWDPAPGARPLITDPSRQGAYPQRRAGNGRGRPRRD